MFSMMTLDKPEGFVEESLIEVYERMSEAVMKIMLE
jgi:hypothetical protein